MTKPVPLRDFLEFMLNLFEWINEGRSCEVLLRVMISEGEKKKVELTIKQSSDLLSKSWLH